MVVEILSGESNYSRVWFANLRCLCAKENGGEEEKEAGCFLGDHGLSQI